MDDNATCHRTLAVQDCLDSEGIQRLVWTARSPDLNPIENVWDALGRQVAGRNYPPTNKNTLIRALKEKWDKLPQQLLDNVVQIVQPLFQAACRALGLLEDDAHCNSTFEEASISESPTKFRELFAIILVFCQVVDPIKLWEKHRDSLSEDVKNKSKQSKEISIYILDIYNQCLILLEDVVISMSGIAATLVEGGKTAHFEFKLPLNIHHSESVKYNISKRNVMAHVLSEAKLIIRDKCSMAHKKGIEALNRTIQDIRGCN
ncbi:ATP-dependent DNA helicase [Trichonephila clavipes]|nr:ATP-dependent DNA helicase [Trichonephila clavipes]